MGTHQLLRAKTDCLARASMLQQQASFRPRQRYTCITNVAATFQSKDAPCLGHVDYFYTGGSVRTETGKNAKCCPRRRDGKECPHNPPNTTKALIRHLHKEHEAGSKLVLAVSSKPAQAKSQRAEALVEAFVRSQNLRYYLVVPR